MSDQRATLIRASDHLTEAIAELEKLVESYGEGQFSAAHPRAGHLSTLSKLRDINKSLKRGKV